MTIQILTILLSGVFGGIVNFFQLYSKDNKGGITFFKCIIVGSGAAFLVPLFLQMISSNLIESSKSSDKDLLVLVGFCLIASIYSRRFIETIGEKVLKEIKEVKETAEQAKEIAQTNKEEVNLLASKSTEVDETSQIPAEAVTEENKLPSEKTDPNKATNLTKESILYVFKALRDQMYTFRTLKGIAKDAGLSEKNAQKIIEGLKKRDWVTEIERDGKLLFALTEKGNKVKVTED